MTENKIYQISMTPSDICSIYLHFPFCRKVCPFCSFAVLKDQPRKHSEYRELLVRELTFLRHIHVFDFSSVASVYLGGGTPSRFGLDDLTLLMDALDDVMRFSPAVSRSIELNPEDVGKAYVEGLKNLGINRVSLGVQSFSKRGLETLGRMHSPDQSVRAIETIVRTGISDFNLDLMFGYPEQTLSDLMEDLKAVIQWKPTHISAYCLTVDKKTAAYRRPAWRSWGETHEELIAEMYLTVVQQLTEAGYHQYEISNFARKGYQSLNNLLTWQGRNYLGLGIGAHSLVSPFRWHNHRRWKEYKLAITNGVPPQVENEKLDREKRLEESLLLGLRMTEGMDLEWFAETFDMNFPTVWYEKLDQLAENKLLVYNGTRISLTVAGMLLADEITAVLASLL